MDAYPPTAADYAQSSADGARRAAERSRADREALEERVVILEGQVAFLAKMVQNMRAAPSTRAAPEDLDTLDRIVHYKPTEGI